MNKRITYLIFILIILITVFTLNLYITSKKNLNSALDYYKKYDQKAKEIIYLQKKYSIRPIKIIKQYCKLQKNETLKLTCKIPKNKLYRLSAFLNSNIKIKSFSIKENNNSLLFNAELIE
jgi:hypothetical protein